MLSTEQRREYLIKFAFWGSVAIMVLGFIHFLLGPLTPFIIAFAVAALLQPVLRWVLERKKLNRGIVSAALTIICYVLLVGLVVVLLVGLFSAVIDWASDLPDIFTNSVRPWIEAASKDLLAFAYMLDPGMGGYVERMLPDALSSLGSTIMDFSVSLVSWASSVGTKLPGAMLAAVICVIATVFMTKDYELMNARLLEVLPAPARDVFSQTRKAIVGILGNFAHSYMLILLITFFEIWIGLSIIGMENAVVIAVIIAVFDILPIVGSGMVLLPWAIFTLLQGSLRRGIMLLALYIWVVIARQVIEPRIVSKRVGLHPLATLLFMWLGLKLFGGVGMLALPIIVLILKDLNENGLLNNKMNSNNAPSGDAQPQE